MKDFDCITAYSHFRKLPYTFAIASVIINFICSVVAVNIRFPLTDGSSIPLYSLMGLSRIGFLLIWWVVGLVLGFVVCYLTAVIISPTIIRTTIAAEGAVYGLILDQEPSPDEEMPREIADTKVVCPICKTKLSFTQRYIPNGRKVVCLKCGERFTYQRQVVSPAESVSKTSE